MKKFIVIGNPISHSLSPKLHNYWLKQKNTAIWTVCFIGIWQAFGFNMVLYLAGLTSIPRELY